MVLKKNHIVVKYIRRSESKKRGGLQIFEVKKKMNVRQNDCARKLQKRPHQSTVDEYYKSFPFTTIVLSKFVDRKFRRIGTNNY